MVGLHDLKPADGDPPVGVRLLVAESDGDAKVDELLVGEGREGLEVPGDDLGVDGLGHDDAGVGDGHFGGWRWFECRKCGLLGFFGVSGKNVRGDRFFRRENGQCLSICSWKVKLLPAD